MNMPRITILYAALLIALGLIGYYGLGQVSATALIPTFVGLLFLMMGILASKEHLRKRMMHAAMALAVVAVIGSFGGLVDVTRLLTGSELARPAASISRAIMAGLSLVYLAFGLCSFFAARRNPPAAREQSAT